MTPSNGNIFRVTGPLCGESIGYQWIPFTKASDAELWCFLWSAPEQTVEKIIGGLRRRQAYYSVAVMNQLNTKHRVHILRSTLYVSWGGFLSCSAYVVLLVCNDLWVCFAVNLWSDQMFTLKRNSVRNYLCNDLLPILQQFRSLRTDLGGHWIRNKQLLLENAVEVVVNNTAAIMFKPHCPDFYQLCMHWYLMI